MCVCVCACVCGGLVYRRYDLSFLSESEHYGSLIMNEALQLHPTVHL